jgi:hypothetical protein
MLVAFFVQSDSPRRAARLRSSTFIFTAAPMRAIEDRRDAGIHDMLRPTHGRGRIDRHDLPVDQPIE